MPYADLHTHTCYSDARPSPEELVAHAAALGLKALAITDHENTRGARQAVSVAAAYGIELIPAFELTTRWDGFGWPAWGGGTDVLGYFVDWDHPAIVQLERQMLDDYHAQIDMTLARMRTDGFPVTLAECFAVNPHYVSGYEVIKVLQAKGMALGPARDEAFDRFNTHWRAVCEMRFPIAHAIETIHVAGGVAVLAHPVVLRSEAGERITARDVAQLVEMGLDGIEIYHYRMTEPDVQRYFLDIAISCDLLISGGSDEHGWPEGFPRLGRQPITPEIVEALRQCSAHWR